MLRSLKRNLDCRQLVERDLGQPKSRTRAYSTFKCPFHHERQGYSLVVYADHWHCFGKCGVGGDVIGWLMRYHALTFQEACVAFNQRRFAAYYTRLRIQNTLWNGAANRPTQLGKKTARRIAEQAAATVVADRRATRAQLLEREAWLERGDHCGGGIRIHPRHANRMERNRRPESSRVGSRFPGMPMARSGASRYGAPPVSSGISRSAAETFGDAYIWRIGLCLGCRS